MYAGYGPALSFLSDESAICSHIVEKEYGGLRMKTPDVEFKVRSLRYSDPFSPIHMTVWRWGNLAYLWSI